MHSTTPGTFPARLISLLLHPVLIPFLTFLVLLQPHRFFIGLVPAREIAVLIGCILASTLFFPLLMIFFFLRSGLVSSCAMERREERTVPLLSTAVFYFMTWYFLKEISVSTIFSFFMLGSAILAVLSLFINFLFKISLHMVALGGAAGFFTGLNLQQGTSHEIFLAVLFLLCGLTGYARLKDGQHTPAEVYSGWLLGSSLMLFLIFL